MRLTLSIHCTTETLSIICAEVDASFLLWWDLLLLVLAPLNVEYMMATSKSSELRY